MMNPKTRFNVLRTIFCYEEILSAGAFESHLTPLLTIF